MKMINKRYIIKTTLLACILILTCFSCQKPPVEKSLNEASEQQDSSFPVAEQAQDTPEEDDYHFVQIILATRDDIIKALEGEWTSKESGSNFMVKFDGSQMLIGEKDAQGETIGFDIKPGSPIEIVPSPREFKTIRFNDTSSTYTIQSMYFVNNRIALTIKDKSWLSLEDELVLTRGITDEDLFEAEGHTPKPNLVFNIENAKSAADVLKSIQGTWEGRDNCNYTIMIKDKDIIIRLGIKAMLQSRLHLSKDNPAQIELDSDILEDTNVRKTVFGLYYLDDTSVLLSVFSNLSNDKYEYILRKPEYFGRFIMDKEIIPQIEGEWEDDRGQKLTIKGNTIEYDNQTDTFHVKTYNFEDKEHEVYHLVSDSYSKYILEGYMPFKYEKGKLSTQMVIMGARNADIEFHRVKKQ